MTELDDVSGLEKALMERARKLSEEHLVNGRQARDLILLETRQRLRREEERETAAAKAQGERVYQQRAQAVELELRARLHRLRWELANDVLAKLQARLSVLAEDEPKYLSIMVNYLHECAQAIERDELIVHCNARDFQLLRKNWARHAQEAAPNKRLTLSPEILTSIGGVMIVSADQNIRFDNTFEGRMERLADLLQGAIAERLTPQSGELGNG